MPTAALLFLSLCASQICARAQTFTTLADFDGTNGSAPASGPLIQGEDGNLYGTTTGGGGRGGNGYPEGGTVFRLDPISRTLTAIYNFCSAVGCTDGDTPNGGLIQATDGNFYGTTLYAGNPQYAGTVFRLTPGGVLTTLYSFCSEPNCTDGAYPRSGLIQASDGNFYGTTSGSGQGQGGLQVQYAGTVFRMTPDGVLTTLHYFCPVTVYCADGASEPVASLIQATDGNLYGTTAGGDALSSGTVFKITLDGMLTTLHSFSGLSFSGGAHPAAPLIQATDGFLYGTTEEGGPIETNVGTVFKISTTGTLTTLYTFCSLPGCADGGYPSGLAQASDGLLYGTTGAYPAGSGPTAGTVFSITTKGALTTLYTFCSHNSLCPDGKFPSGLVQAVDGFLYGATSAGGENPTFLGSAQGTVFRIRVPASSQAAPPTHRPIIFIPGVAGSYLYLDKMTEYPLELWPDVAGFNHLSLLLSSPIDPSPNISAPDVLRSVGPFPVYQPLFQFLQNAGYLEYSLNGDPSTTACDTSQKTASSIPNLFAFPYDWRKDIGVTAKALAAYVSCVQSFYPGTKVDIVTHSMGSLVARRYILDYGGSNVNALITLAAPWLGAPKFTNVLETGDFEPFVFDSTIKAVVATTPGPQELLPAQAYFDLGGTPMGEQGWDFNNNGILWETYTSQQFLRAIDVAFSNGSCPVYGKMPPPTSVFCPGTSSFAFHGYTNKGNAQDNWSNDSSGVQYFHIYGYQGSDLDHSPATTIGSVLATPSVKCIDGYQQQICSSTNSFELTYTVGDGTVPLLSAERISDTTNYNAPTAILFPTAIGSSDHQSLVGNLAILKALVSALLAAEPSQVNQLADSGGALASLYNHGIRAHGPNAQSETGFGPSLPCFYVTVNGGDAIAVSDTLGNSTALVPGTASLYGSVPSVNQMRMSPRISIIDFPAQGTFTVSFTTTAEPLAIEVLNGTSGNLVQTIRYIDLSVPAGVSARLVFSGGVSGMLQLDTAGNGTFSTTMGPSLSLNGPQAQDVTPPTIAFSLTGQGSRSVAISAQDSGSGVKDVFYSLDGSNYLPYTSPVTVAATTNAVFAFADDNAGNRSASSYVLSAPVVSLTAGSVLNSASFSRGAALAPGSIASVFGTGFSSSDANGTNLWMDGVMAPLYGVFPQQINFQVPWELSGEAAASLVIGNLNVNSLPISVPLSSYAPGLFSMNSSGAGQGAIVNAISGELAASSGAIAGITSQPVHQGDFITIYCTGLGPVNNQPGTGVAAPAMPLATTTTSPVVKIGGVVTAQAQYSGLAPGFFGLYQVNVQVPNGVSPGNAVTVTLSIGGASSNIVTIAVQ